MPDLTVRVAYRCSRKWLADALPQRWLHVRAVARRASGAAFLPGGERQLLICAALLHDIGYSPLLADHGFHPLDGALYLRHIGASERLCALVARHSCAYSEAELRGLTLELAQWPDEQTSTRDALWWADMTTGPDGESVSVHQRIAEIQARYGPNDLVTVFIRQAEPELVAAVERTEARLRAAGVEVR
ncbi:HD domain-containing protein [Actinosynnema sp. NPDC023794]